MTAQVFISHSSEDASWVELIAAQAKAIGIHPYLAQHDPAPGTQLSAKVREAIRASNAVIVLLTVSSVESLYVGNEIGVAIEQDKLVVPLVHPDVAGRSLAMLNGLEYIPFDFEAPGAGATALLEQLAAIAAAAKQQQTAERQQEIVDNLVLAAAIVLLIVMVMKAGD